MTLPPRSPSIRVPQGPRKTVLKAAGDRDGYNHVEVTLPEPPSANRWWRNVNGRMVTSKAARDYKDSIAKIGGGFLIRGDVLVSIDWYRGRKSGDLDKRLGVALDAMQGVFFENDAKVIELAARRFEDAENPRIHVTVKRA